MALLQLIKNGRQDWYLTANRQLFYLTLKQLETLECWKIEYAFLANALMNETRSPSVIVDIVVSYAGTKHSDALMTLGQYTGETKISECIDGIQQKRKNRQSRSAIQLLDSIASIIKYPRLCLPETQSILQESRLPISTAALNKIIALAMQISAYDDWEESSAGLKVAGIFYQIILLGWSTWILDEH
jgi:hypothetical protein